MALTAKMVASEVLMCGVKAGIKSIPIVGEMAVNVIDGLQRRHESLGNATKLAEFDSQLSRVERSMRDTVEKEIRSILTNLGRPALPGPELTREMTELRQIYEQGWVPNLFEGLLRNSTHLQELRRNPKQYGRMLADNEAVDPENGMHLLIEKDATRILELPAASLALLLSNQAVGIPSAEVRTGQDIWAFPTSGEASETKQPTNLSIVPAFHDDLETSPLKGERIILKATNCRYSYRTWDYEHKSIVVVTNMRFIVRLNENGDRGIFRGIAKAMDKRMVLASRIRINGECELYIEDIPTGGFRIRSSKEMISSLHSALIQLRDSQ